MRNDANLHSDGWQAGAIVDDSDNPPPVAIETGQEVATKKRYVRAKLQTANQIADEIARVYRATKTGELDPNVSTKLVYILSTLAKVRSEGSLEERIEALELKGWH